jgi:stage III sporulation protein AH
VKKILKKNQIMITALTLMIAVAGYLNFAGAKIGEEDFISVDGTDSELTYEISDEDMYAISLREDNSEYEVSWNEDDIVSLDTDDAEFAENYLDSGMELASNYDEAGATVIEQETPGEAVFTSASAVSTLAGAKLLKEQTKAQNKAALMEIINSDDLTEDAKKEAVNSMITLTENAQKESDAQMLLEAKGFTQAVVSISGDCVDVMVEAPSLSTAETAQIIDIVQRKTEVSPENIIITVSGAE